ncbi:MAG TPA: hypothetical protein VNU47_00625 [Candidatus Paceibacterota bacterium]|nr:hypothetical protein [Candidatus Paceibacterota bacterium]
MTALLFSTFIFMFVQLSIGIAVLRESSKHFKFKDHSWKSAVIAVLLSLLIFAIVSLPILWFDIPDLLTYAADAVLLLAALAVAIRFVYEESWKKVAMATAVVALVSVLMVLLGRELYTIG